MRALWWSGRVEPIDAPADVIPLPPLPSARSVRVGADLRQTDVGEQAEVHELVEGVFAPWYAEEQRMVKSVLEMVDGLEETLERATRFSEDLRQRRALLKAQNEYLFRCRELLRSITSEVLPAQHAAMSENLQASTDRREGVPGRFPRAITLEYPREELLVQKGDGLAMVLRKRWKLLVHSIRGFPARDRVPYRDIAEQYLVHRQHAFLASEGTRFVSASASFLSALRAELLAMAALLRDVEQRIPERRLTEADVPELFTSVRARDGGASGGLASPA